MKTIKINLIVLVLLLVLTEIILRFVGIGYGNSPLNNSVKLHHIHPFNYSFQSYSPNNEYGGHIVMFDQLGNRVNENTNLENVNNEEDIWFFGDSFTESVQVSWDNSYVGLIDSLQEFNSINFGVSSYSPLLYYIQLKEAILTRKSPHKVYIQIYSNDYGDDKGYEKLTTFKDDEPLFCNGNEINNSTRFFRKSHLLKLLKKSYLVVKYVVSNQKEDSEFHSSDVKDFRTENFIESNVETFNGSRFSKSILQIKSLLENNNIEYSFFCIPSKYSTNSGDWKADTFDKKTNVFFSNNKIQYINLINDFKNNSSDSKLFYPKDIHLNKNGHKVLAKALTKDLYKVEFVDK